MAVLAIMACLWPGGGARAQTGAQSDLTVFDVQASVKETWQGQDVEISALISNKGTAAAKDVSVAFYDGSKKMAERTIAELGPGANQEVVVKWSTGDAALGRHTIRVMVDPTGTVAESNETNNEASTRVTVNQNPLMTYSIPLLVLVAVIGIVGYKAYTWMVLRRLRYKQRCKKEAEGKNGEECFDIEEEE